VRRHSKMSESKEDDPITASRDDHAQSKCHRASNSNSVNVHRKHCISLYYCFRKINHLVLVPLHSSSDVREAVSGTGNTSRRLCPIACGIECILGPYLSCRGVGGLSEKPIRNAPWCLRNQVGWEACSEIWLSR
jgi:hypothetical protein